MTTSALIVDALLNKEVEMICPFKNNTVDEHITGRWDCVEDNCALWDDGNKCCSVKSITIELIKLNERFEDATSIRGGKV